MSRQAEGDLPQSREQASASFASNRRETIPANHPQPRKAGLPPDFRLQTLDGKTVRLSDLQGKVVLINFWATWCKPCREEMPEIVKEYTLYHDRGFEVMSVDEQEDDGTVQKWVDAFGMQFPVAMDRTGEVGLTFRAGTQFPTSLWIDPQGIVTDIKYGPMNHQYIEDHITTLQASAAQ